MRRLGFLIGAVLLLCMQWGDVSLSAAALSTTTGTTPHTGLWLGLAFVVFGVSAISSMNLTLLDIAKRLDPSGKIAVIIEMLSQTNEIMRDMVWKQGNLPVGERTSVRTGLPDVFWRLLNAGVLPSKSHTAQITEQTGMLEAYSQVDVDLAKLGDNAAQTRLSEARAFFEAMSQEFASTLFYGSSLAPEEFIGLAYRYSTTSAGNGENIIKAGGTGSTDNTSIWLVQWDENTVCGIFPLGSRAGIVHNDLGQQLIQNANAVTGALMLAFVDHWQWKGGLCVKDWRHVVRIANVDVSNLSSPSDAADLFYWMADAEERLPYKTGRRAFYCNRTIRRFLRHQSREQVTAGGGLTFANIAGEQVTMFGDTPVRICDALLNTEDVVV